VARFGSSDPIDRATHRRNAPLNEAAVRIEDERVFENVVKTLSLAINEEVGRAVKPACV